MTRGEGHKAVLFDTPELLTVMPAGFMTAKTLGAWAVAPAGEIEEDSQDDFGAAGMECTGKMLWARLSIVEQEKRGSLAARCC